MDSDWRSDGHGIKEKEVDDEGEDNELDGVWSLDIEQSFLEALAIYPPCGRRKIILSDEGKMYGRNELIARYIKLRTGKNRTRKQVSSHIQVLARRRTKEVHHTIKDPSSKKKMLQNMSQLSSAQIVSASSLHGHNLSESFQHLQRSHAAYGATPFTNSGIFWSQHQHFDKNDCIPSSEAALTVSGDNLPDLDDRPWLSSDKVIRTWHERCIASSKLRLIELTAYVELKRTVENVTGNIDPCADTLNMSNVSESGCVNGYNHVFAHISQLSTYAANNVLESVDISQIADKFPDKRDGGLRDLYERGPQDAFFLVKFWADINTTLVDDAQYAVTCIYEGSENYPIKCSTKVCSFGKQVVEKIDNDVTAQLENGKFVYRVERSPMCEYMINFITKLNQLPEKYMMNSVLENFTILQLVSNQVTHEVLLCICYAFEVSSSEHGAQHHIYKLVAS